MLRRTMNPGTRIALYNYQEDPGAVEAGSLGQNHHILEISFIGVLVGLVSFFFFFGQCLAGFK